LATEKFTIDRGAVATDYYQLDEDVSSAPYSTAPIRVCGEVCAQIAGAATAVNAQVERSTRDPAATPNWAPAGDPIVGNPSTGIQVKRYDEPTRAWWRVSVLSKTGGAVSVVLSGEAAV
jgi:hypothetical protein